MEASAEQDRRGFDPSDSIPSPVKNWRASFAPDFVADTVSICQTRESYVEWLEAFLEQGCRLVWLFEPEAEKIFRPGSVPETAEPPATLSAMPVPPGLSCDVEEVLVSVY